jgi:O-succinylbenzoic acid--CoA ligase
LELLEKDHSFTLISVVPYQLNAIFKNTDSLEKLKRFRIVLIGGAPVSEDLSEKLHQFNNNRFYHTYGMTETYTHVALCTFDGKEKNPAFYPLKGIEITTDERSCARIIGFFHPDHIQSNDIIKLNSDGGFHFVGRSDFVINSGGIKISPEVVEAEIRKVSPGIDECLIVGRRDAQFGQKVTLLINESTSVHLEELNKLLELPEHFKPRAIEKVSSFNYLSAGKVDRKRYV